MDRQTELLVALRQGLSRLGPGSAECTLKALALCEDLPAAPEILDVGCGTGAQTLVLASATAGRITATDLIGPFLAQLEERAAERGPDQRIQTLVADMNDLPFPQGRFDLTWIEGAVYTMGFDNALVKWRPLAKRGGYLVVSELSWFRPDPPAEIRDFWADITRACGPSTSTLPLRAVSAGHLWGVSDRNQCPGCTGITVQFAPESLSSLRRNCCPLWTGIGVQFG